MDYREKLLQATARVYAETGYRGATTRRIAQAADVSEITLFRHFGSKDALITEALSHAALSDGAPLFPDVPANPERELIAWCRVQFVRLHQARSLIRKVIGESEEHPEILRYGTSCPHSAGCDLHAYLQRLRASGLAEPDTDIGAAATMLMGALFAEAMTRDVIPKMYPKSVDRSLRSYVTLLLRGIGAAASKPAGRARARAGARGAASNAKRK